VTMTTTTVLQPCEPQAGPWTVVPLTELVARLEAITEVPAGRPRVVAVDGRSASGKTTLARRLHEAVPSSAVVHTDDVAWWEPYFEWAHLLSGGVLAPLREGEAVDFRPPAWERKGREGSIQVPAGLDLVIVEGVGSSARELVPLLDGAVWVQSDYAEAERRGIERDVADGVNGDREQSEAFWHDWMTAELAFLERDRPWRRAPLIASGTPTSPHGADEVVVADGPISG
jgi:hypothetical protein